MFIDAIDFQPKHQPKSVATGPFIQIHPDVLSCGLRMFPLCEDIGFFKMRRKKQKLVAIRAYKIHHVYAYPSQTTRLFEKKGGHIFPPKYPPWN